MNPEENGQGGDVLLLVDLSNVCRSADLPPVGQEVAWSRFYMLINMWEEQFGRAKTVSAVADSNLRFALKDKDPTGYAAFIGAMREGIVEEHSPADERILSQAESAIRLGILKVRILSLDNFVDYRRTYPWIDGNAEMFVGWSSVSASKVSLESRTMTPHSEQSMSMMEERSALRALGYPNEDTARKYLQHHYRCTNQSCLSAKMYPDRLPLVPRYERGVIVCPNLRCSEPLQRLELRKPTVALKVSASGDIADMLLELDDAIEIGRTRAQGRFGLQGYHLTQEELDSLSDRHVRLSLESNHLYVEDLGSKNGTWLMRWNPATATLNPPELIASGDLVRVMPKDSIRLAEVVTVRCSGRAWPLALPLEQVVT